MALMIGFKKADGFINAEFYGILQFKYVVCFTGKRQGHVFNIYFPAANFSYFDGFLKQEIIMPGFELQHFMLVNVDYRTGYFRSAIIVPSFSCTLEPAVARFFRQ